LVASLFELSNAANNVATNTIEFYNISVSKPDSDNDLVVKTLINSLSSLAKSSSALHATFDSLLLDENGNTNSNSHNPKSPTRRIDRDPNAPKKPLTAYFAFSNFFRQALKLERRKAGLDTLPSIVVTQLVSTKWSELPETEKLKWKDAYNKHFVLYQTEKLKYLANKDSYTIPST
ncbi:Hmo1p ASCRUDRAFT_19731, partial [Ascoidea rubescens DSM 1968]